MEFTRQELNKLLMMAGVYRQNEERQLRRVRRNIKSLNEYHDQCLEIGKDSISPADQMDFHKSNKAEASVLMNKIKLGLVSGK